MWATQVVRVMLHILPTTPVVTRVSVTVISGVGSVSLENVLVAEAVQQGYRPSYHARDQEAHDRQLCHLDSVHGTFLNVMVESVVMVDYTYD